MSEELAPRLDPKAIEPARYKAWQDGGYFHVPASRVLEDGADPYVIVIPPPNVTAVLHMGHGLNTTIQDVLIRWQRMRGRAALWVPGTDHAGIATQNVVERRLAAEGCHRDDLGRDKFVEAVWRFVGETGGVILDQLKAIGASCDWDRTRFTLDEDLSRAVRETFVHLYEKGLVYRGEYIINWCPRCLTALSNEEAEGHESQGKLWHLRYPLAESAFGAAEAAAKAGADALGQLEDGRWYLTVSTTRPETMLGDTGVAVSPKDERYRALVGAEARLPLTGRTIPIVADTHVDAAFGSGMVKVTPAHDPNDFDIAGRTGLEVINVMTPGAHMNDNVPEAFQGLERFAARKAVLKALDELGLLSGESDHTHSVPHCYRCDTVVEPRLSLQWFVKMGPLAEPALKASRDGTITFTPPHWQKVYEHWMETIRDWCISRQLWWGHRIPVWYCEQGHETVGREDPTECGECGSTVLEQDPDVLDTWFSSQLWPFSVFGWPEKTPDVDAFYPGHSMVTAPEILFFWVARMIM
ncbi:MAG: valine--tRNA ligase, partial [Gemmatimonadales bacterium]|nr:valine--tRNA ligase [Gemmatimonadales bacterium]